MKLSNEQIIALLQNFQHINQRPPIKSDFDNIRTTICRRFGSWKKALASANITPIREVKQKQLVICTSCGKEFLKRYCEIQKSNFHFCSRSCAAITNNKKYKKRQPKKYFCSCGEETKRRTKVCEKCKYHLSEQKIKDVLLTHTNKYSRIRDQARDLFYRKGLACQKCGYSKHVEVCHIKPIYSFPPDTLVEVVNSKENILILCRNCHWELDHPE
jgi:hypothetical protein